MWEEQVEKAFIFCWAEWNFMMVLMMYIYERNVPILVNTERVTTLCSMNHVSEQEIFIIREASQRKWSTTLESQNSMFKPRQSGGNMTRQPAIQQQTTSHLQTLLVMMVAYVRVCRWTQSGHKTWWPVENILSLQKGRQKIIDQHKHYRK